MQPIPYFGEPLEGLWFCEAKIDGWRVQVIKYEDGRAEIWGRRLERKPHWTPHLPYLIDILQEILPPGLLLDAELCHPAGRRFIPSLFTPKGERDAQLLVFDIIFYEGNFIGDLPLIQRKEILKSLTLTPPFILLPYEPLQDLYLQLREAVERGEEGIVIKKADSPYILGREAPIATENWRKIKP